PVDIVISSTGTLLYVSHGASGDVRVLDAGTLKLAAIIPVGPRAWWMVLTPDGRFLYVTVGRANEVVVIDTRSNAVAARIRAGEWRGGVAIAKINEVPSRWVFFKRCWLGDLSPFLVFHNTELFPPTNKKKMPHATHLIKERAAIGVE